MGADSQDTGMPWSEVLALPPVIDLDRANRALMLGRSLGYDLARNGRYPCESWRAGSTHRVSTTALWALLGIDPVEVLARAAADQARQESTCPSCGHTEPERAPTAMLLHPGFRDPDADSPAASAA